MEKPFSKCWEKSMLRNSRNALTIYWTKPNNFNFTISTLLVNKLWQLVSSSDAKIHRSFFVKSLSESNYLSTGTKIFVFWRICFYYDIAMVTYPPAIRKKKSRHLKYFRPCKITIYLKNKHKQNLRLCDHVACLSI